jgi:hypothetical protein
VICSFAAGAAAAPIVPLRDARFVTLTGDPQHVAEVNGVLVALPPLTVTPLAPFADFDGYLHSTGVFFQRSTLRTNELLGDAEVSSDGGGQTTGSTTYEIDFSVASATTYHLTGSLRTFVWDDGFGNPQDIDTGAAASLGSPGNLLFNTAANQGPIDVAGILQPGLVYTLLFQLDATGLSFEVASFDFALTVPEPSLSALLVLVLLGARGFARREVV